MLPYYTPAVFSLQRKQWVEKQSVSLNIFAGWSHTWQCRTLRVNCSVLFWLCRKNNYKIINQRKVILEEVFIMRWGPLRSARSAHESHRGKSSAYAGHQIELVSRACTRTLSSHKRKMLCIKCLIDFQYYMFQQDHRPLFELDCYKMSLRENMWKPDHHAQNILSKCPCRGLFLLSEFIWINRLL